MFTKANRPRAAGSRPSSTTTTTALASAPAVGHALTWTVQAAQARARLARQTQPPEAQPNGAHSNTSNSQQPQAFSTRSIFDLAQRAPARSNQQQASNQKAGNFNPNRRLDELENGRASGGDMRPLRGKGSLFSSGAGAGAAGSQTSLVTRTTSATPTNQTSSSHSNTNSSADDDDDEPDDELRALKRQKRANKRRRHGSGKRAKQQQRLSLLERACLLLWRASCFLAAALLLNLLVYFWPLDERFEFEAKVAPLKPRPRFEGPLALNSELDRAQKLWEGQFHAPESMAWTSDKRAFFTGVEGGFVLLVEPYAERWTIAARLNARHSVEDLTEEVQFLPAGIGSKSASASASQATRSETNPQVPQAAEGRESELKSGEKNSSARIKFCEHDIELYGARAEFEPARVELSRCSRPLGIRLAPDDSRLYVMDPLSGLYRVELVANWSAALADRSRPLAELNRVSRLIDLSFNQIASDAEFSVSERPKRADRLYFGDDIAVQWDTERGAQADVVFMTDCSRRWTLRYLLWLMLENDDSGRLLAFETGAKRLRQLEGVVPVRQLRPTSSPVTLMDERRLSFPNGLELTADGSALLISDLNNRRILKHYLSGPQAGTSDLLLYTPGFNDNIRRGLDLPDGTPTYWYACGCAVEDGRWEMFEVINGLPRAKRLFLRWMHFNGRALQLLGGWLRWTQLADLGVLADSGWLKMDPYCTHSIVGQFDERGRLLRSLHAPSFSSNFKLLSEAHQVPLFEREPATSTTLNLNSSTGSQSQPKKAAKSALWLGSVYYSYLGRLELSDPID